MINQYLVQSCKRAEISHSRNRSIPFPLRQTFFMSIYLSEELIHFNLYSRTRIMHIHYITPNNRNNDEFIVRIFSKIMNQSRTILIHIHK